MRDIKEIWIELQEHPDFITGRIHTKQHIVERLEDYVDDEDFSRIAELFVDENKTKIADEIDNFECDNYQYGTWIDNLGDLIEVGTKKIFAYDSVID